MRVATPTGIVPEMQAKPASDDNAHTMGEQLQAGEPSPWPAPARDGGPQMETILPPPTALPFTPEFVPCLRNCKHYFLAHSHFDHGNPEGTFGALDAPRQRHHICMRIPGVYLELSGDSPVYECNRYEAESLVTLRRRKRQHDEYGMPWWVRALRRIGLMRNYVPTYMRHEQFDDEDQTEEKP